MDFLSPLPLPSKSTRYRRMVYSVWYQDVLKFAVTAGFPGEIGISTIDPAAASGGRTDTLNRRSVPPVI